MENSQNFHDTLCQLLDRYSEELYPTLASLLNVTLPNTAISASVSSIPEKAVEVPNAEPQPITPPPPTNLSQEKTKPSDWKCVPLHPDLSQNAILKEKYPALKDCSLPAPKIPCSIFVYEENNEEVLFFNRLAKILTQQLFPTKLTLIHAKTNIFVNNPNFFLALAPLNVIRYKIPTTDYHQSLTQNGCIFLPLYSSLEYEKDSQLKRNLWAILNRLPFAYTPKSS
ncbi:hypothetical protein CpB0957 [Chlamydia pneumoniae TW-183]|uniref:Uncharacterized protein n=2 Tax=Chlamydia pneumoniae TaxID=83558 RepID=Q9Z6Y1_CHLPN|nr:hypothetical protein [Chlamydia pneumoniae]AAD19063.1 CT779 hypothetical protein [Chlamydia pneumoniae CWL029]AAF38724.1 conserved hypothetical protein [Chlamydia pneumoniae AR39]AAP98886.1 hypothetical protein CpB0957 [Chlamydia pneumoniae TW-183]CRI33455.1 Uncharacterized protein BN1224_Wien1_A_09620 [Chlamydia pneumoniae]CRI36319.1 Uncharacterized protein BN1224_CM1_A_09660 [Chlamydia pneumoniae]